MQHDDLDGILAAEEEILPSSGFAASVMEAVRREAATPPPIPFPWRRAVPGMAAAVAVLVSIVLALVHFFRTSAAAVDSVTMLYPVGQIIEAGVHFGVGWIALALLLSLASLALSIRLSRGRV
jgi:hypothetical protein